MVVGIGIAVLIRITVVILILVISFGLLIIPFKPLIISLIESVRVILVGTITVIYVRIAVRAVLPGAVVGLSRAKIFVLVMVALSATVLLIPVLITTFPGYIPAYPLIFFQVPWIIIMSRNIIISPAITISGYRLPDIFFYLIPFLLCFK